MADEVGCNGADLFIACVKQVEAGDRQTCGQRREPSGPVDKDHLAFAKKVDSSWQLPFDFLTFSVASDSYPAAFLAAILSFPPILLAAFSRCKGTRQKFTLHSLNHYTH